MSADKLSEETLIRDRQGIKHRKLTVNADEEDPSAYVVVTLLLGTTQDRPLFDQVVSLDSLKANLERLAQLSAEELLTSELIWTPENNADSLTEDELLTEFSELVML